MSRDRQPGDVVRAIYATQLVEVLVAWADRVHAAGDELAEVEGWQVQRVGLTGRSYRDPRFTARGGAR